MRNRINGALVWVLMYSLTSQGPSVEESYPTEDACVDAGFRFLDGADRWKVRSNLERPGSNWLCAERDATAGESWI